MKGRSLYMKRYTTYGWVWIVIIINIIVYLFGNAETRTADYLMSIGAYRQTDIKTVYDYYTLFTSQFIHSGPLHLITNMLGLYHVTQKLVHMQSSLYSLIIYILGIVFVAIGLLFCKRYTTRCLVK